LGKYRKLYEKNKLISLAKDEDMDDIDDEQNIGQIVETFNTK